MDFGQFQKLLQKINSLNKNMSLDSNISKIEQDLMKTYVSQLYEACVADTETAVVQTQVVKEVIKPAPVQEQPRAQEVEIKRVIEEAPAVIKQADPIVQAPVQEVIKEVNIPNTVNQNTSPPKVEVPASNQPKTLNERLAEAQAKQTTNDKFKEAEEKVKYTEPIIINVDHLKDINSSHAPQMPKMVVPPPVVKKEPVVQTPPPVANGNGSSHVASANSIAAYFDLHQNKKISEISDRLSTAPIADLTKAIGLNDKISMIRELWSDDQFAFNNTLAALNSMSSFEEAKNYVIANCVNKYQWDEAKKINRAKQFIDLLRRRYNQ